MRSVIDLLRELQQTLRRAGAAVVLLLPLLLGALASPQVAAEAIAVKSAVLRAQDESYVVDAEFDFSLPAPLEQALLRGTPLYFVLETEVTRNRSYWFDERINSPQSVRRLTFHALTNSYRVDTGHSVSTSGNYATLDEALRQIRLVRGRALLDRRELRSGERYDVSLRLRLDTTQLPKPLQVNTLVSDWYRVVLSP